MFIHTNAHSSPNITRPALSRMETVFPYCILPVICTEEMRQAYRILVGKIPNLNTQIGICRSR